MSAKYDLPWHRVVNSKGKISLKPSNGYALQKALLESEGIKFSSSQTIDLSVYLWQEP
jgi:methylated-DNA-protein-cysteine methyltransferase-like protein